MTLVFSNTQPLRRCGGQSQQGSLRLKANMAYGEYLSRQDILYGNSMNPTQPSTFLADKWSDYMK